MDSLNRGLKNEVWTRVSGLFAPDVYEGIETIRSRMEERWKEEQILDLKFTVKKIYRSGQAYTAKIRWEKSFIGPSRQVQRVSGKSEILFKRVGERYLIQHVKGDPLY